MCMLDEFHARLNKASKRLVKELGGEKCVTEFVAHHSQPMVATQLTWYDVYIDNLETENLTDDEVYDLLINRHMDALICTLNALETL